MQQVRQCLGLIMQPLALSIYEEKTNGTFRRLQAAPLSRTALLLGKLIPFFIINLIQMALMLTVGVLAFHITLGNDPMALVLVAVATAAVRARSMPCIAAWMLLVGGGGGPPF